MTWSQSLAVVTLNRLVLHLCASVFVHRAGRHWGHFAVPRKLRSQRGRGAGESSPAAQPAAEVPDHACQPPLAAAACPRERREGRLPGDPGPVGKRPSAHEACMCVRRAARPLHVRRQPPEYSSDGKVRRAGAHFVEVSCFSVGFGAICQQAFQGLSPLKVLGFPPGVGWKGPPLLRQTAVCTAALVGGTGLLSGGRLAEAPGRWAGHTLSCGSETSGIIGGPGRKPLLLQDA
eukprot:XP_028338371.1 uncharacterized protein LOC114484693 [Physeter catodon]